MRVTTDFPTGSGEIAIAGESLSIGPELRDSSGDRWYWHLRLQPTGRTELKVDPDRHLGRAGPAVSRDGGISWGWWGRSRAKLDLSFEGPAPISLASTIPYGCESWERFAVEHLPPPVQHRTLVWSESGRPVPLVTVPGLASGRRLLVTARHHACEATASLVLEGLLREAVRLRANGLAGPEVTAVPLVDIDGVENGDQGKGRLPHDHNRDYGGRSRYASSAAIRSLPFSRAMATACIDLHTPGLAGPLEERPFLVSSTEPSDHHAARNLSACLARNSAGEAPVLVFPGAWNRADSDGLRCFTAWSRSRPGVLYSAIVEYPNAVDRGMPVSAEGARRFGRALHAAAAEALDQLN